MLSSGAYPGYSSVMYSHSWLQMDRVYSSKDEDEEEEEVRGLERSQRDLEERIRPVYPSKSRGLGICEPLFRPGNLSPYRMSDTDQDPGPPAPNVSSGIRCVSHSKSRISPQLMSHSLVQGVREAILDGIHPKIITKGSSGSYFARSKADGRVQTVGYVPHLRV